MLLLTMNNILLCVNFVNICMLDIYINMNCLEMT